MFCQWLIKESLSSRLYGRIDDEELLEKLEDAFETLQHGFIYRSLLKKYLTKEIFDEYKFFETLSGFTLLNVIQDGVKNKYSDIGVYAPDPESYIVFSRLFDPIIEEYHRFTAADKHPPYNFGNFMTIKIIDKLCITDVRISCRRNLKDYGFLPSLTKQDYKEIEQKMIDAIEQLDGKLMCTYYPLESLDEITKKYLADEYCVFTESSFLKDVNANNHWPVGRGIFLNFNKSLVIWCNEEDHLCITAMQKGGNFRRAYTYFVRVMEVLNIALNFKRDDRLGYLTVCPTNLGAALRVTVFIKIKTALSVNLKEVVRKMNLEIKDFKEVYGEDKKNVYVISNKKCLGITEYDIVTEVQRAIYEICFLNRT